MKYFKNKILFMDFIIIILLTLIVVNILNFNSNEKPIQKSNYEHSLIVKKNYNLIITKQKEQINYLSNYNNILKQENKKLKEEKLKNDKINSLSYSEWECLYRTARAEAGANSAEGQKNVVYVILNRVNSEDFPNTIEEVVFQKNQFSCVWNKSYNKVEISDFTIKNVQQAVLDYEKYKSAEGALYFTINYFPYDFLFTDEVGHNFYK